MIDSFFIVETGLLEIQTYIDGNTFSIQKLPKGTIINQRNFMLQEKMEMILLACMPTNVLVFTKERLQILIQNHKDLEKTLLILKLNMIN